VSYLSQKVQSLCLSSLNVPISNFHGRVPGGLSRTVEKACCTGERFRQPLGYLFIGIVGFFVESFSRQVENDTATDVPIGHS